MIFKPSEASDKWCPHARQTWAKRKETGDNWVTTGEPSFNLAFVQFSSSEYRVGCIANRCSQWRWADDERGYCGLAGAPTNFGAKDEVPA